MNNPTSFRDQFLVCDERNMIEHRMKMIDGKRDVHDGVAWCQWFDKQCESDVCHEIRRRGGMIVMFEDVDERVLIHSEEENLKNE